MRIEALLDRLFRETDPRRSRISRWEVLTRVVIGRQLTAGPLITRYRLLETPFGGLYLHHHHREDADRDQHDHPWWFASLLLSGGYAEEYRPDKRRLHERQQMFTAHPGDGCRDDGWDKVSRWRTFPLHASHRTTIVFEDTWSLLVVGPRRQDWGFWLFHTKRHELMGDTACAGWRCPRLMFVPWRTYTKGFREEEEVLTIM